MTTENLVHFWGGWMFGLFFLAPFVGALFNKPKAPDWNKWKEGGLDADVIKAGQDLFAIVEREKTYMIRAGDIMRKNLKEGIALSLFVWTFILVVA